jgi:alpha-tubulin suppressor-like RCC1 family protein
MMTYIRMHSASACKRMFDIGRSIHINASRINLLKSTQKKTFHSWITFAVTPALCIKSKSIKKHCHDDVSQGTNVFAFGKDTFGTCCVGECDSSKHTSPTSMSSLEGYDITKIVASNEVAAIVTSKGQVLTWGSSYEHNVLGHSQTIKLCKPMIVAGLVDHFITDLSISDTHACAISLNADGTTCVFAWGSHALGIDSIPLMHNKNSDKCMRMPVSSNIPIEIKELADKHIVSTSCGSQHTLALSSTGEVYAYGMNYDGALGLGKEQLISHTPQKIESLSRHRIVAISAGTESSLFLTDKGKVFACGSNEFGQCGIKGENKLFVPTLLSSISSIRIAQIATKTYHSALLDVDGRVYTFGYDTNGQLGHGRIVKKFVLTPKLVASLVHNGISAKEIKIGERITSVITNDGDFYVTGDGRNGQLGHSEFTNDLNICNMPIQAMNLSSENKQVFDAAMGRSMTFALTKAK